MTDYESFPPDVSELLDLDGDTDQSITEAIGPLPPVDRRSVPDKEE